MRLRAIMAGSLASLGIAVGRLGAQPSTYLPLDHPGGALIEPHITRGDLIDPAPMIRPLRRVALRRGLEAAGGSRSIPEAPGLAEMLFEPDRATWAQLGARAGAQAHTSARREILQPVGPEGVWGYGEAGGRGRIHPVALAVRGAFESRLPHDPEWADSGAADPRASEWRVIEGYASLQAGWFTATLGQMARTWGPGGVGGLSLGTDHYPTMALTLEADAGPFSLTAHGSELREVSAPVRPGARYLTIHRLGIRLGSGLHVSIWESGVVGGASEGLGYFLLNPLRPVLLAQILGNSDDLNLLLGGDLSWRVTRRLLLEAEAVLDDLGSDGEDGAGRPARWALTLGASGALGPRLSWRVRSTAATSLVFRTHRQEEYYTEGLIGISRNFPDQAQLAMSVGIPVRGRWLVSPELVVLRQGEGTLQAPFPAGQDLATTPTFFIGTARNVVHGGLSVSGEEGPVAVSATGGLQHSTNADHVPGRTRTVFEGRIQATIGFSLGGKAR